MKRSARHSEAIVVDLDAAARMLGRTRDQWSPEDHAIVEGMFHALVETTRQLHARGASLARLRRLWGIRTTEKLSIGIASRHLPTRRKNRIDDEICLERSIRLHEIADCRGR